MFENGPYCQWIIDVFRRSRLGHPSVCGRVKRVGGSVRGRDQTWKTHRRPSFLPQASRLLHSVHCSLRKVEGLFFIFRFIFLSEDLGIPKRAGKFDRCSGYTNTSKKGSKRFDPTGSLLTSTQGKTVVAVLRDGM